MKNRTVSRLLYAHEIDMGGLPVRQPLPTQQVQQIDPFLLLHHAHVKAPSHIKPDHAGIDPHPHRGFPARTIVQATSLSALDSLVEQLIFRDSAMAGVAHPLPPRPPASVARLLLADWGQAA